MKTEFLLLFLIFSYAKAFPEEENDDLNGLLWGGDMLLTPEQRVIVETGGDISLAGLKMKGRASMSNVSILWFPNGKTVPYNIHPDLEKVAEGTFGIMQGLREWEERSCLRFVRRTNQKDYIEFFINSGCWSYVGRQGGGQNISLADGCWGKGTVTHEIGHAMGFGHEQNRPDRDDYITVRWENIPESKKHNFQKYTNKQVDSLNTPYDYQSFMQYSKTAFGFNDSVTLDPKKKGVYQLGQRLGFTPTDQQQVMQLYKCNGVTTRQPEPTSKYIAHGFDTCDFENGLCNFVQDDGDDFDWSFRYGGTPSGRTGPEADHTTSRMGSFVYVEASLPRKVNDKARLISQVYDARKGEICMSYFFHMYASNKTMMGEFHVYLTDDSNNKTVLKSRRGSMQENEWLEERISFTPNGKYQITFEGVRGNGYQGDIAIDDFSLNVGKCAPFVKQIKKPIYPCTDINDREAQYCDQWEKAGFCSSHAKEMQKFCSKTCKFC